jgi:integrase
MPASRRSRAASLPFTAGSAASERLLPLLAAAQIARLEPGEISQQAREAVAAFAADAQSLNTARSYRSAMEYWQAWHLVRYGERLELPVHANTVHQFVVDHAMRPRSPNSEKSVWDLPREADELLVQSGVKGKPGPLALSTLEHRVSVLSAAHRGEEARLRAQKRDGQLQLPNPCEAREVRELLRNVRSSYAKHDAAAPNKKPALTSDLLALVLKACDMKTPKGLRDRALLAFAFATGGRRRSEVAEASLANLRRVGGGFEYHLAKSKTNQAGQERDQDYKPLVGEAADALAAWLQAMKAQGVDLRRGALFRRIRGTVITEDALTTSAIYRIVTERCEAAIPPAADGEHEKFTPHSLRSGFLTEAGRQQVPLADAMAMSGHTDVRTALGYFRAGALRSSRAARLMDSTPPSRNPSRREP